MRLFRLPHLVKKMLPQLEWRGPETDKVIYLTFDDGPIPEVTDFVLHQLARFQAKGTFFCVGENLAKHPEIASRILRDGHRLGNHTYNHLKAWKTNTQPYLQNVHKCAGVLAEFLPQNERNGTIKPLFRPPYGQVSPAKLKELLPEYRIIMWDLLTCDYDASLTPEKCLENSLKLTRPGSIVVFHDSLKAWPNLKLVLPRYLAHLQKAGYRFGAL